MKTWLGVNAALVVALGSASAGAHGGIPRVTGIHFEPGNPGRSVLAMDMFGILTRGTASEPYRFVCAETFGGSSLSEERRAMTVLADGTLVVAAAFDGLQVSRDGGCNFEEHPAFTDVIVFDVVAAAGGRTLYVLESVGRSLTDGGGVLDGQLHRSDDGAQTFVPVGPPFPSDFAPHSLAISASSPEMIYVAGNIVDSVSGLLLVLADGGDTWTARPLPVGAEGASPRLTVSPSNADDLALTLDVAPSTTRDAADSVWVSSTGGVEWTQVLQGTGDIAGLSFAPDGTRLALGGDRDGLWTTTLGSGAISTVQVSTRSTWGLAWTPEGLFMGLDAFAGNTHPGLERGDTFGNSTDEGATLTSTVSFCDVRPPACKPTDKARARCGAAMNHLFNDYFASTCAPAAKDPWNGILDPLFPGGSPDPAGDGGVPNAAAGGDDLRIESGCAVGRARGAWSPGAFLGLVLAAATLRRRRSLLRPWSEPPSR